MFDRQTPLTLTTEKAIDATKSNGHRITLLIGETPLSTR